MCGGRAVHAPATMLLAVGCHCRCHHVGGGVSADVGAELGLIGIQVPAPKVYETLSSGAADAVAMNMGERLSFKLNEVAKYFIDVPMGASWGHIIVMNTDKYASLTDSEKKVIDSLKGDHLTELLKLFRAKEDELKAKWTADGSVEIIKFPADEFLKATLGSPKVQAVRDSWKDRAIAAGMPAADAERVVNEINN